jgi:hypothetical protein
LKLASKKGTSLDVVLCLRNKVQRAFYSPFWFQLSASFTKLSLSLSPSPYLSLSLIFQKNLAGKPGVVFEGICASLRFFYY